MRRIEDQGYAGDRTPRPLDSPERTSGSLVGTATLMSGMDDLSGHTMAQDVLRDHTVGEHGEPVVHEDTLKVEKSGVVGSVAPFDVREEEEVVPSSPPAETQESEAVTESRLGITSNDVEHSGLKPEETEVDFEDTATPGHPGYGPDTEPEIDELEAGGAGTEDHWESGSPPATTTSQQGGDPLVTQAGPDDEVDHVRDSESMTASIEDTSAQMAEDVGTHLLTGTTKAEDEAAPTEEHTEFPPESEALEHAEQKDRKY